MKFLLYNSSVKKILSITVLVLLITSLLSAQAFSSQSDTLTNFDARPFFVSTETGWDFFAVPDLFVGHRLGWAINNLFINTGFYWAFFPNKNTTRAASADIRFLWTIYDADNLILQPFIHTTANFGSVLYTSAHEGKCSTGYAVNPRADAMMTIQNGFFYYIHPTASKRFALTGKLQAGYGFAFTKYASEVRIKYGYTSIFSFDTHINMFSTLTDFLSIELQNKFSYNSKKGLTYSISPMLYLFKNTPFVLSIGGQIPLQDINYWSVGASIAYSPPSKKKDIPEPELVQLPQNQEQTQKLTAYFIFEQDSTNLFPETLEYSTKNNAVLDEILFFIHEFGPCLIHLEGHANRADFTVEFDEEQEKDLVPLSLQRVEEVKKALIERGIESEYITTEAAGAAKPVVSFFDEQNSWKNRRVEITLTKINKAQ